MKIEEILNKLGQIDCSLSPEWLTCDGELSASQVQKRYRTLMAEWNKYTKLLGRNPTYKEIYGNSFPETMWNQEVTH